MRDVSSTRKFTAAAQCPGAHRVRAGQGGAFLREREVPASRWRNGEFTRRQDAIAVEAALAIVVGERCLAVTMRTPGRDIELAAGFLWSEGLVTDSSELIEFGRGEERDDADWENVVRVALSPPAVLRVERRRLQRNFMATSSCGVCGHADLEAARCTAAPIAEEGPVVSAGLLAELPDRMRTYQKGFEATGGVHAVGLFTAEGELLRLEEDIGRHNAMDKVIGAELLSGAMPLNGRILVVSGRASFEMVQKAAMARAPILCSVSAVSSLAVDLAESVGITLAAFARGDSVSVYSGAERVVETTPDS